MNKQLLKEFGIALAAWGLFTCALLFAGVAKEFVYAMF